MSNTVHLHRVMATSPEKIYRAFIEADALAKWLPPNGFVCTVHHLEPKIGGAFQNVISELHDEARATRSEDNMLSSFRANACVTRTNLTIRTCLVRCR